MNYNVLEKKASWLRESSFELLLRAKQGHPGSLFSQIEILTTLFYGNILKYSRGNPNDKNRDKLIISKGHAAMGLYPIFADIGYINKEELDKIGTSSGILRIFGNISIPGIDATSGSLGHGPGIGIGFAMASKLNKDDRKTYVIISEGEMYEGSVWESALFASHHQLDNLILILDRNRKIILGDTEDLLKLDPIEEKWKSFGFTTIRADGHSISSLLEAFNQIKNNKEKPIIIIAETIKGKGISFMENDPSWHYWQGLTEEQISKTRLELKGKVIK